MTYILGLKYESNVYIVADTALTHTGKSDQHITSFGEKHDDEDGFVVQESYLKILKIGQVVFAFSGDLKLFRSIVESFKKYINHNPPRKAFELSIANNKPFQSGCDVSIVVSYVEDSCSVLLSFNADGADQILNHKDGDLVQLGSIKNWYYEFSAWILEKLCIFKEDPIQYLHAILSCVQSYGIHDNLIDHFVGGMYCGIVVTKDGIEWQKDILYCLYDSDWNQTDIVFSLIRENSLIVSSGITGRIGYFLDSITVESPKQWFDTWKLEPDRIRESCEFDYVVLLHTGLRIVTLADMQKNLDSDCLRLKRMNVNSSTDKMLRVSVNGPLFHALTVPLEDRRDGSLPFKFNWAEFKEFKNE